MKPDNADREVKRERVLKILARHDVTSVLLSSAANVNWYLDGARTHVSLAAGPIVSVEVARDGDRAFVTSNESARLLSEELPNGLEIVERPWFVSAPANDEERFEFELRAARQALLPGETARYRQLCTFVATVLTDALTAATPGMSEYALAALIAADIVAGGADPIVVLVAGEDRRDFRHPLPTSALLGRRVMVVLCARRFGLIANVTRSLRFGRATAEECDADARIRLVEADAFAATAAGSTLDVVFEAICRAYPERGFAADEWSKHHQGGPAGYASRDPRATTETTDLIVVGQPFSWNPSAQGTKIEDTVLVGERGVVPMTVDPRWPVEFVNGIGRPVTLER